ncbi:MULTISPECIES: hypothetical protein [Hyphobacterium]|uniref:Histidine phosphatase family protein n=1 Tax=Hyphobacterium vulgare TaxID=1736751 RepID=A0ABV6ZWR3_9PROT
MPHLFTPPVRDEAAPPLFNTRRIALAFAGLAALVMSPFAALAMTQTQEMMFDRPLLLAQAPEDRVSDLLSADRHILVVRHARKQSEDCNAIECPLGEPGQAMVAVLSTLIGDRPVDAAYASAACRTAATAEAGGAWVMMHRAGDDYPLACGGGTVDRTRAEAINDARESLNRWTLAAEHSNTVCLWVTSFAGEVAASEAGCSAEGSVGSEAYGDIYWLYRVGGQWHAVTLPGVFDAE